MKQNINENNSIKELENQAKNTKYLMDKLNKAYIGLTTDEIIKLILKDEKIDIESENRNDN